MKRTIIISLSIVAVLFLSACGSSGYLRDEFVQPSNLVQRNHNAGAALLSRTGKEFNAGSPILYASFVNVDDLQSSSSLGRIMSQQVTTPFANSGFYVVEMLLRQNVYIKQREGEFLLSRELKNISDDHNAQAVIVGTYAVGTDNVFVSAKLIDVRNNKVLSSYDYPIPMDEDIKQLLQ